MTHLHNSVWEVEWEEEWEEEWVEWWEDLTMISLVIKVLVVVEWEDKWEEEWAEEWVEWAWWVKEWEAAVVAAIFNHFNPVALVEWVVEWASQ